MRIISSVVGEPPPDFIMGLFSSDVESIEIKLDQVFG